VPSTDVPGPVDDPSVSQLFGQRSGGDPGGGTGGRDDDSGGPEVGVSAAVERGPAELSSDGEPVPDNPHASLDDAEPARSTDEL
jgi:hypothetical protein